MPHPQAILLASAAALAVAWLVALQMISNFRTSEELGLVLGAITADLALADAALLLVLKAIGSERALGLAALGLALATIAFASWPTWMDAVDARSTNPFPSNHRDAQIMLEFLVPCLAGSTVLWRLLVRGLRRVQRRDPRTNWPWWTIAAGSIAALHPLGFEILGSALAQSPSDWFAGLWAIVSMVAAVVLVVIGAIEYVLRARRARLPVQAEV